MKQVPNYFFMADMTVLKFFEYLNLIKKNLQILFFVIKREKDWFWQKMHETSVQLFFHGRYDSLKIFGMINPLEKNLQISFL